MMNGGGTWRGGKEEVLWLKDPLDAVRRALWGPGWKQGGSYEDRDGAGKRAGRLELGWFWLSWGRAGKGSLFSK